MFHAIAAYFSAANYVALMKRPGIYYGDLLLFDILNDIAAASSK